MLRQRGFRWALLVSIVAHIVACLTVPIADKSGENAQPLVQHVKERAIEFVRIVKPKPPPPPKIKQAPRRHKVVRRRVRRRVAKPPRRVVRAPQREALKPPEEPRVAEVPPLPEEKSVPELEVLPPVPVEEFREPELVVPQPKPVIVRPTPVSDVLPQPEAMPELEKAVPAMVVAASPTEPSRAGSVANGDEMASVPMHVADSGVSKSPEPPAPKPTEIALVPSIAASPGVQAPGAPIPEIGDSLPKATPALGDTPSRSLQVGSGAASKAPRHFADAEPVGTPLGSAEGTSGSGPIAPTKPGPAGSRLVGGRKGIALGDPDAAGGPRGPEYARPRGRKAAPTRNVGAMRPVGSAKAAGAGGHGGAGTGGDVNGDEPMRIATTHGGSTPVWAGHAGARGAGRQSGGGGGTRIALVGREQPGGGGEGKAGQPWRGSGAGKAAPRLGGRAGTGPAIFGAPEKSAGGRAGREGDGRGTGPVRYDVAFGRPDGTGGPGLPGARPTPGSGAKLDGDGLVGPGVTGDALLEPGAKAQPEGMWRTVRMALRGGGKKPAVGESDGGGPGTGAGVGIGQPLDAGAGLIGPVGLGIGPHGPSLGDLALRALGSLGMPGLAGGTEPGVGQGSGSGPGKGTPLMVAALGAPAGYPIAGRGATGGSGGARGTGRDVEEPVAIGAIERRGGGWHGTGLSSLPGSGEPVMSGGLGGGLGPIGFGTGLGESRAKSAPGDLYVGVAGSFDMPMGVTASDYQADAEGMRNLLAEVRKRTNVHVTVQDRFVPLTFDNIKHTPVLHLRGHRPFSFSDEQRGALRQYVARGGTIVGEDSHGPFGECFSREMTKIFGRPLEDLPEDHDLYRCYYVLDKIPAGDMGERYPLQGLQTGDRLGVIFSRNDYGDCWEGTGGWVKPESREPAFRIGVNMYIYAIAHWHKTHQ